MPRSLTEVPYAGINLRQSDHGGQTMRTLTTSARSPVIIFFAVSMVFRVAPRAWRASRLSRWLRLVWSSRRAITVPSVSSKVRVSHVAPFVAAQGSKPSKGLTAEFAFKRHFSGMHSLVDTKIVKPWVELSTNFTRVFRCCWLSTSAVSGITRELVMFHFQRCTSPGAFLARSFTRNSSLLSFFRHLKFLLRLGVQCTKKRAHWAPAFSF